MLYIYRASAGSGKTFLLTGFYIELLFRKEQTPALNRDLLFSEILAVTFTNKATAEMKERIIKDLNNLRLEPTQSPYYKSIKRPDDKGHVMSDEEIQLRAQKILKEMLGDYSSLHISTIDSFFQQVVRSFAHELNVQGSYEIELDADMVLDHAVTQFLLNLDPTQDRDTFDWMLKFSNNQMQNGANWNVHYELLKLAKVLTTEEYRHVSQRISDFTADKNQLTEYIQMLDQIIRNWKTELKKLGQQCTQLIENCGLKAEDFARSQANTFYKWAKGENVISKTIIEWAEDPKKWFTKANAHLLGKMGSTTVEALQNLLIQAINHLQGEPIYMYNSAVSIRKNIYQLGILCQLERAANEYCAEQGVKLLSSTTQMLNALVAEQSSPFIYEKTGTRIMSYMIDEFQDTSGMQWQNFSPLLKDSLGTNNRNLIVGDVKQSIYRWRGSDWELLHSKLNSFEPKMQAYDENHNQLRANWRSDRDIIRFNNEFFTFASHYFKALEPDNEALSEIETIYDDVEQVVSEERVAKVRAEKKLNDIPLGEVHFEQLPSKEYNDALTQRLPLIVMGLQQKGYKPKDILILCRKRSQCHTCAKILLDYQTAHPNCPYGMKIMTQEALLLGHQPVIRALIAVLEYLHNPQSDFCKAIAHICWQQLSTNNRPEAITNYFEGKFTFDIEPLLNLPLFETIERLIVLLPESARQNIEFIQAFCDVVLGYCAKEGPDLDGFLKWWSTHGSKCSVTTPENQDAIRIMTIHQSKGLDGEAVIVPFAQDNLDIDLSAFKAPLVWCEPQVEPFARKNVVLPIQLNRNSSQSIFRPYYEKERIRAIIDNLNTVYVAFTRAKHVLAILSPTAAKSGTPFTQEKLLQQFFEQKWDLPYDGIKYDEEQAEVDARQLTDVSTKETLPERKPLILQANPLPVIKQTEYIAPDDSPATRGTVLHAAFSAVIDNEHIDSAIRHLFQSGTATLEGNITIEEVLEYVHHALDNPVAAEWFNPANRILTEQDILTATTHTQRPDRIVFTPDGRTIIIDYKTGKMESEHHTQVAHYMKLMRQMSFPHVEGYLWYVEDNEIVKVTGESKYHKRNE